ncbi:unnamed protein product [Effrenium voratum]|uniref:Uncharacterized protein n=1 Tax=Effrenium voratum TaxID=2562239 RepID=A0AA36MR56_9DINO|nr:unnamed protein product [Effrenium voratum]CAJ1377068.1 unnamed protein product [Effrenium voratum]CAJ1422571.1 unnamed protein product [Effrenium voratum]
MGQVPVQCCQQEQIGKRCDGEIRTGVTQFRCDVDKDECLHERVHWTDSSTHAAHLIIDDGAEERPVMYEVDGQAVSMQTLNYSPVRYELCETVDTARSQERYSNTLVHTARMNTRRQLLERQAWLSSAVQGRYATMLLSEEVVAISRVPAKYYLDHNHSALSFLPGGKDISCVVIMMDAIQAICALTDGMMQITQWESHLTEMEKKCGVLLKYRDDDAAQSSREICFLEESEAAKDLFIHVLTVLWLEKPQSHSVWF